MPLVSLAWVSQALFLRTGKFGITKRKKTRFRSTSNKKVALGFEFCYKPNSPVFKINVHHPLDLKKKEKRWLIFIFVYKLRRKKNKTSTKVAFGHTNNNIINQNKTK